MNIIPIEPMFPYPNYVPDVLPDEPPDEDYDDDE